MWSLMPGGETRSRIEAGGFVAGKAERRGRLVDVSVDDDGHVQHERPRAMGLSVAPDTAQNLHARHRPASLGGTTSYPVWRISSETLGSKLRYAATSQSLVSLNPPSG